MVIDPRLFTKVDQLFEAYDKPDVPGCALAIIHEGAIIYKRGYGLANLEYDVPISPSTVFDIGSVSKQFTAACALLLEYQGKLKLEDDINKYVPELNYKQPVTLLNLIHHTSGIPDYLTLMGLAGMPFYNDYPEAQLIELIANQPLTFTPGKQHVYSNSGYFLLAEIIARVSGQSLNEFATEHIFRPLGMNDTQFYDDHTRVVKNRAMAYTPVEIGFAIEQSMMDVVGDGGIFTTVEDLFLWDQNFYDNKLEGGQAFTEKLLKPGELSSGKKIAYSFGLHTTNYRGQKIVWHNGSWAGYLSEVARLPEQKLSIILLANRNDVPTSDIMTSLFNFLLADVLGPDDLPSLPPEKAREQVEKFQILPEDLQQYTGQYTNESLKARYTLTVSENTLVLSLPYNMGSVTLEPIEKDVFNGLGVHYEFKRDKERCVQELRLIVEQVKPLRFKKVK
jgi:CubicO group peptidase (beta-lactamase class C family)